MCLTVLSTSSLIATLALNEKVALGINAMTFSVNVSISFKFEELRYKIVEITKRSNSKLKILS